MAITKDRIQERIEDRAKARVDKDYSSFVEFARKNPILNILKLNQKEGHYNPSFIRGSGDTVYFFNDTCYGESKGAEELFNLKEVKESLFAKYVKEESDSLLEKLNALSDYLTQTTGE
jgi:hypothetical protein